MTLASLVERGEVVPDTLVSQVLVPYLKKERMRSPHAPVLMDSYPLVPSQLETLERGDQLFGRAVLVLHTNTLTHATHANAHAHEHAHTVNEPVRPSLHGRAVLGMQ